MTRDKLIWYLDNLDNPITGENIGQIRRSLMMPFDCEWNAWVRDETAAREKHIPEPNESSSLSQIRIEALKNTVKSLNEQIEGLRNELKIAHAVGRKDDGEMTRLRLELAHVTRHRDFLETELHKRDEQLDAVKIERDAAEKRAESFHTSTVDMATRIQELENCDLIRDFSEQSKELAALKKERDEQGNYWPISELLEENKELRNKLELAISQQRCAVERADRLDRTAFQLRKDRDIAQNQLPAKDREIQLLQEQLQDLAARNVNLRTSKVAAENELRRIRQELLECGKSRVDQMVKNVDLENFIHARSLANVHCVLPAYKPLREEMWRASLAAILSKHPSIDSQWGKLTDDMRQFITGIFSLILDFLPQLDVTTTCHPAGASAPGNRNPSDPLSGRVGNSENGQTSIASEGSTTPPVSGQPS